MSLLDGRNRPTSLATSHLATHHASIIEFVELRAETIIVPFLHLLYQSTMSEQQAKKALKKEGRRNAQAQKVEKKNKESADYFWRCAQSEERNRKNGSYKKPSEASKESLFARQESSGINFSQVYFYPVTTTSTEINTNYSL
jgi:hypothetical protein